MNRNKSLDHQGDFEEVVEVLAGISDVTRMTKILEELLTPAERDTLATRWTLLRELADGIPQREIASHLGISLCKITRGSKLLKDENSVVAELLNRGQNLSTGK